MYCLLENEVTSITAASIMNNVHSTVLYSAEVMKDYIEFNADSKTIELINQLKTKLGEALCQQ